MRQVALCLLVLVVTAVIGSAAEAGLVSLFAFDESSGNPANSISGVNGGTLYSNRSDSALPQYVTGELGNAIQFAQVDRTHGNSVDATSSGFPNLSGLQQGSLAFWVNVNSATTAVGTILSAINTGSTGQQFSLNFNGDSGSNTVSNEWGFELQASGGHKLTFQGGTSTTWRDGQWHSVVLTWNVSQGSQAAQFYLDGVNATSTFTTTNTLTGSDTFGAWSNPVHIGQWGRADSTCAYGVTGSVDDLGVNNNVLTGAEAAAIFNLGEDSLKYGLLNDQVLFNVFTNHTLGTTSDGKTWEYATGLAGYSDGQVVGHDILVLDAADGLGVKVVPEPSTLALLAAGLTGLLAYAWRKRK